MKSLRFYGKLTAISLGKLCQRRGLLAGLALLCLILPLLIGPAAQSALSQGVSFSGITLAVVSPDEEDVSGILEQIMANMEDISEYCEFRPMDREDAITALEQGEVTAVLELPEDFMTGVLNSQNPDVNLIVPEDRPLEALLTLWIGQSATDMLSAFQNGIYRVLELYREYEPEDLTYNDAMGQINMRYINWTINRQDMFRTRNVSATQQLPIDLHYGLSLLAYLLLSVSPLFMVVFQKEWVSSLRRLRVAGRGEAGSFACTFAAVTMIYFPLAAIPQFCLVRGEIVSTIWTSLLIALFCAAFASVCCLLSSDTGSCGALAFSCSVVFLTLGGGIVPPVMLPATLRNWMDASPVTWMRNAAALPAGEYEIDPTAIFSLLIAAAGMILVSAFLYLRRSRKMEGML